MKISNEPTPYLLLKAGTDSAWDCCDFAIVYLSKEWRQTQSGRLEAVKPFKDDISFQSLNFYDISVGFYQPDEDGILGSEDLPEDNNWCFVELTETELERLVPPDNVLVSHILAVFANGEARYRAYGKHTDERFYTEKFPLQQILDILASHEF